MSKIFVLMTGDYEALHVEDVSEDPEYIIERAIQVAKENKFMHEFYEIEVWENHEIVAWYGDSTDDKICRINNHIHKGTDDEIKTEFYERIKKENINESR